ncbi:MAG: FdhD protein [Myxococcota bacterium]|jgi:FdhD protein
MTEATAFKDPPTTAPSVTVTATRYPEEVSFVDHVSTEEPLAIEVDGVSLAVLMRTPGEDRSLVAGFLLTEGVIDGLDDVSAIAPCADPNKPDRENLVRVRLASGCEGATERLERARRTFFATSSCGICGKTSIDAVIQQTTAYASPLSVSRRLIAVIGETIRARQQVFDATGGLHAAALVPLGPHTTADTVELHALAEDVGRHNAVDKVIGASLLAGAFPLPNTALWISGRASFEVVQKAAMAGVRVVISVGAPTSLAVGLAERLQLTLIGFARGGDRFNRYVGGVD